MLYQYSGLDRCAVSISTSTNIMLKGEINGQWPTLKVSISLQASGKSSVTLLSLSAVIYNKQVKSKHKALRRFQEHNIKCALSSS
jgi:hypothetical protein